MMPISLKQYNLYANEKQSNLRKALTSTTGVGEALIPQSLEKEITNTIIFLSPEIAAITPKKIAAKYHSLIA